MRSSQRTIGLAASRGAVIAVLLATASAFSPAWADVYRSVDAQGHVIYSDRPSIGAQKTAVEVQQADPVEAARLSKEQAILKAEDDKRKKQELVDSARKEKEDQTRQAQCAAARKRDLYIKDVHRLYRLDADGNRVYYTDAELDAMRAQASQAVSAACTK